MSDCLQDPGSSSQGLFFKNHLELIFASKSAAPSLAESEAWQKPPPTSVHLSPSPSLPLSLVPSPLTFAMRRAALVRSIVPRGGPARQRRLCAGSGLLRHGVLQPD